VIEVQHISKRYGRVTAVDDVSFRVERGEILGFLGPNGAGKTTTMRILTGYMPPTEGRAIVAGFDIFDQPRRGQAPHRVPARDAAALSRHDGARVPATSSRASRACRRRSASERVDTSCAHARRRHGRPPLRQALEGLQAARRAGAGAHPQPDVLILDEPTAGLDPKQIIETRELIRSLAGDHTIVLSTHILPEVSQTCQRVVIINKGRVVAVDTPDNLTARLRAPRRSTSRSTRRRRRRRGAGGRARRHRVAGRETRGAPSRLRGRERARRRTSAATSRAPSSPAAGACSSCGRCA
jgi:ABC-2 type transport system ATP-binding protein